MIARKKRVRALLLCAGLVSLTSACAGAAGGDDAKEEYLNESFVSFDAFLSTVIQEPDTGMYLVDGDMPIESMADLEIFYERHVRGGALTVYTAGSGLQGPFDVLWTDDDKLSLTYCVSRNFGPRYEAVVEAMAAAADSWEDAADVNFEHLGAPYCDAAALRRALFTVAPASGQSYLARAFFPYYEERELRIDEQAFSAGDQFSLAGILKHELGHTLGFVHEHTRPEAGVWSPSHESGCFTPVGSYWRAVTEYDSRSVMIYPWCHADPKHNFAGDFYLTAHDIAGAAALYGVPKTNM